MKKEIEQLAKKLFNPYAEELKFDEKDWRVFLNRLFEFEQAVREEVIDDFIKGRRCLSCGELKGEGGELTDSCLKCLEEN